MCFVYRQNNIFFHVYLVRGKHSTGTAQKEIVDFMKLVKDEVVKAEPWLGPIIQKMEEEIDKKRNVKK